jgi:predicted nuclease of predicted toxin-antitoxin system
MNIWVDAQLSPSIDEWIVKEFSIEAKALRDLGLRDAEDEEIFMAARKQENIISTFKRH